MDFDHRFFVCSVCHLFYLVPDPEKSNRQQVEAPFAGPLNSAPANTGRSAFELPVDSFENRLKTYINEGTSDKK